MQKVCHVTSVHDALDDRIYYKECLTLSEAGYEVFMVAPGESFEKDGILMLMYITFTPQRCSNMR